MSDQHLNYEESNFSARKSIEAFDDRVSLIPDHNIASRHGNSSKIPGWMWILGAEVLLLLGALLMIRHMIQPRATYLVEQILTEDGKSFPSGRLAWSQKFTPLPCGKSPAEALASGCHFDIVATAWLPPRCIDHELATEFKVWYPWQYFPNQNGTAPYSTDPDVLGSQEGLIWTTNRWHIAHCVFMWRKLNRALVGGWQTDSETIKQGHTDHCSKSIVFAGHLDETEAIMEVIYPPC